MAWHGLTYQSLAAITVPLLCVAGCVRIETGQTVDEAVESSEAKARQIRGSWANKFQTATPVEMAEFLADHYDRVTAVFVRFGHDMVDRWEEGIAGRGEDIAADEMRSMIDRWIHTQKPILTAYEDNLEYGFEQIKLSNHFDERLLDLMNELVDHYYQVYSGAFFPSGSVEDYQYLLEHMNYETQEMSGRFRAALERF